MPLNVQIICICSKNAIRKNVDFQKNTAECKLYFPNTVIDFACFRMPSFCTEVKIKK
jgi:hypothetical protein